MKSVSHRDFFRRELEKNDLVSAPLAGITDPPFRLFMRDYFNGIAYSEMVSVEGIKRSNPQSTCYLDILENDRPVAVQFFGGNAESYPEAIDVAMKHSGPDAFDINMGCPVRKVIKSGGGCALLLNLPNIAKIVRTVRTATEMPFSIKIRTGWDDKQSVYREILDIAQSEGADALILHARTRTQMFGGRINYDALAETAAAATIPVIGNGDVTDCESYARMKETGVNGVMVGRAVMGAPWIFQSIRERKNPAAFLSPAAKYDALLRLYGMMLDYAGQNLNKRQHYLNIIKKIAVRFSKSLSGSAALRVEIYKDQEEKRFLKLLDYFKEHPDNEL